MSLPRTRFSRARWSAHRTSSAGFGESLRRVALGKDDGASLGLGIGGSRSPANLKCLHAHAAFALARPGYELGERILAEVDSLWPVDGCCTV